MKYLAILSIFTFFLSACQTTATNSNQDDNGGGKPVATTVQTLLNDNRGKWNKAAIKNYQYEYQRSCFCPPEYREPLIVKVSNGQITKTTVKKTGKPATEKLKALTVNQLFDKVQDAIDKKAHSIKVEYDDQYGFPASITIDYDQRMADEELYLSAKNLQVSQ